MFPIYATYLRRDSIMYITNVVFSANIGCEIDLRKLCYRLTNVRYDPRRFPGLIWQHKNIGGNCLIFSNGVINCNGKAASPEDCRLRLRRYARRLQRLGYPVNLKDVKCITVSATHTLSDVIDIQKLARERSFVIYEPELFPAANFKDEGVNFCCFTSGKVIITGVTSANQMEDSVYPTLIELELYTRKKL